MAEVDVIVVGAGVAGCIVARRLADAGLHTVLLEAGPATSPDPAATAGPLAGLDQLDRRWPVTGREPYVRGKGLGGGSAINGMLMMAGDTADLHRWGGSGLVAEMTRVTDELAPRPRPHGPLSRAFRAAAQEMGHRVAPSSAVLDQTGVLTAALALDRSGRRSVVEVYLAPLHQRPTNLEVFGETEVVGLVRDGRRVVGVSAADQSTSQDPSPALRGELRTYTARHVVLSAGALTSPRLLLAEGIGNAHVGAGLKDHPAVPFTVQGMADDLDLPITTGLRWSSPLGGGDLLALPMESIGWAAPSLGLVLTMALRVDSEGRVGVDGVEFGHLAHPDDRLRMRTALRDVATLLGAAGLDGGCRIDSEGTPLADLPAADSDLDGWMADHLDGVFHAGCSCRYGAAVGPGGSVLGWDGISVIDSSVLPDLPAGNPQLSVMAVASLLSEQLAAALSSSPSGQRPSA